MSLTQQELDALHGGMLAGGTIARRDARTAAYRAIRCAATEARSLSAKARMCENRGLYDAARVIDSQARFIRSVIRRSIEAASDE